MWGPVEVQQNRDEQKRACVCGQFFANLSETKERTGWSGPQVSFRMTAIDLKK